MVHFIEEWKNMGFKRFYISIVFRTIILSLIIAITLFYLLIKNDYIITFFGLALIIYIITNLIFYLNKTNKDFTNFLTSMANNDFTVNYKALNNDKTSLKLYQTYQDINNKFRHLSFEKELKNQHLQNLVEHMDIGIISVDKNLTVQLINEAFKKLFNCPHLTSNQSILQLDPIFVKTVQESKPNEKKLLKLTINKVKYQLAIHVAIYKLQSREFKLVSVKNILTELDAKEMESYQKLIRVLTHEIMNTLSPIISISNTIKESIKNKANDKATIVTDSETYLTEGINAIHNRSEGLLKFTNSYRKLTRLPIPKYEEVNIEDYFTKHKLLLEKFIIDGSVNFILNIDKKLNTIIIDPNLFDQVLLNVYKNAFEALVKTRQASIITNIYKNNNGNIIIEITDNGQGMSEEIIDQAFIPFFTTKDEGSGIGLSLSKQIMLLHNGKIEMNSIKDEGSTIKLVL